MAEKKKKKKVTISADKDLSVSFQWLAYSRPLNETINDIGINHERYANWHWPTEQPPFSTSEPLVLWSFSYRPLRPTCCNILLVVKQCVGVRVISGPYQAFASLPLITIHIAKSFQVLQLICILIWMYWCTCEIKISVHFYSDA